MPAATEPSLFALYCLFVSLFASEQKVKGRQCTSTYVCVVCCMCALKD